MVQINVLRVTNRMNKSRLLLPIILFSLPFLCTVVIRAQERLTKDRNPTIKIDVDLVLVNATVSDSKGRMVMGLQQENFRIWEDKVQQKMEYFSSEDTPMSIGLVFDATGSMEDKISRARDAAVSFLKTGNPEDEFFLVTFSQSARLVERRTKPQTENGARSASRSIRPKASRTSPYMAGAGTTPKHWISNHNRWRKNENRT